MRTIFTISLLTLINCLNLFSGAESRLLRYPNSSATEICFSYAGDIYTVGINGGLARKLTNSPGLELFPRFSPSGSEIAFSGEYDGAREVYTIPAIGGVAKRLTYSVDMPGMPERQGPDKIIMQWSGDGESIIYRSRQKSWSALVGKIYSVSKSGSSPYEYPLTKSGFVSISPDGSKMAFNKIFREFRTWKRYRGGQADDIYIYDFKTGTIDNITSNPAQDIIPMWSGNTVYFLSDRDKTMNLFAYDLIGKTTKKITNFTDYDVKFPSLGANHIAFENAGYIYLMDLKTEKINKINITVADDEAGIRTTIQNVKNNIEGYTLAPDGKSAIFVARGEILSVPEEKGIIKNLSKAPDSHERCAITSPDGAFIAYISDESGEDEVYIIRPDGSDKQQITNDAKSYRISIKWSPDSKCILSTDKKMRLVCIDIENKKSKEIAKSKSWEISDYNWSPDSKWVIYTDAHANAIPALYLYSMENGKTEQISDEFFESSQGVFSKDSKYIFFVSDRTFNPSGGNFEYNYSYSNMSKIYGVTLSKETTSPFALKDLNKTPENLLIQDEDPGVKKSKKKEEKREIPGVSIDFDNIKDRIFELPVPAGNYYNLTAVDKKLLYVRDLPGSPSSLYLYDFEGAKEDLIGKFNSYVLSADNKKIMFKSGSDYFIDKFKDNITPKDGKLDLEELKVTIDKKREWKQIFNESWRAMKYFFYDSNMHGVDWLAMKAKYGELVPYAAHRNDLTYVIGEMIAELNIGHAYVGGGEAAVVPCKKVGLLGADLEFDSKAGLYKFKKIFAGRNWEEKTRSPLTEPGVKIKEGDYLISIDGNKFDINNVPASALVDKAGKYVEIEYSEKATANGSKKCLVKTLESESELRYYNWVENNRRKVDSATGGQVAYIHIPDMGYNHGLNEFVKYFYPQTKKKALIIDDRYNGGGNVSPLIIERLRRTLVVAKNARNQEVVSTNPDAVMTGPMICLINEQSMSDGDLFPYQFKKLGLGKVIGKRSWGGVIGIRGSLPYVDGGYMNIPEFANFGADGTWILEGVGMTPDIEVDNNPFAEEIGTDTQLNKAIELILEDIKTDTKPKVPVVPKYPIKN